MSRGGTRPLRLVTIGFSHYCEKARWALDRAGLAYVEESHAPLFHVPFALAAGGKRSVPVLVDLDARRAYTDSSDILAEVHRRVPDAGLFPSDASARDEVLALEDRFDRDLGPATRRVAYWHVLHGGAAFGREMITSAASPRTRAVAHAAYPLIAAAIGRALKVDPPGVERSMKKIEEVFALVDERLERQPARDAAAGAGPFLVGDRFTAADLTFASLAVPVLAPGGDQGAGGGFTFPPRALLPPEAIRLSERLAKTRAGAFALRVLAEERRRGP